MPALPKSLMSEVIQKLPDDWIMKSDSIPNYLVKRGIKPEELTTSGLHSKLAEGGSNRLTKQQMLDLDTNREDIIGRTKSTRQEAASVMTPQAPDEVGATFYDDPLNTKFRGITADIAGVPAEQNYAEDIISYSPKQETRRVQSHYIDEVPNYLMHARTSTGSVGGKQTRVVQEMQSDLFQRRRQSGVTPGSLERKEQELVEAQTERNNLLAKRTATLDSWDGEKYLIEAPFNDRDRQRMADLADMSHKLADDIRNAKNLPDAPFEKNWLSKNIDFQLFQAGSEGQEALAVPLEGYAGELSRSSGVQKWYETQVRSTLKKRVKQLNNGIKAKNPKATEDELFSYKELASHEAPEKPEGVGPRSEEFQQYLRDYEDLGPVTKTAQIVFPKRQVESLDDLSEELADYSRKNGLMFGSADDMLIESADMGETDHVKYLNTFINRWDAAQDGKTFFHSKQPAWMDQIKLYTGAGAAITAGMLTGGQEAEASPIQTITPLAKQAIRSSGADEFTSTKDVVPKQLETIRTVKDKPKGITTITERAQNAPAPLALKIDQALMDGAPPEELASFVAEQEAVSEQQATAYVDQALHSKVLQSLDDNNGPLAQELAEFLADERGLKVDQIKRIMPSNDILSRYWKGVGTVAVDTFAALKAPKTPEQIASRAKATMQKYSTFAKQAGGIWDDELKMDASEDAYALGVYIADTLVKNGHEAKVDEDGEVYYKGKDGQAVKVETSMVDEMLSGRSELAYAMAAGIAGAQVPGPWWVKGPAAVGASALAAMAGRREDVLRNAIQTKQEIENRVVWDQMVDAGMADVVLGVLGTGAFKLLGASVKKLYQTLDTMTGNLEGAYRSLKDFMPGLDDDKARALIAEWDRVNRPSTIDSTTPAWLAEAGEADAVIQQPLTGRKLAKRAIEVIPRTQERAEAITGHAVTLRAQASKNLITEIDNRAKDIISTVDSASTEEISRIATTGIEDYKKKVKDYYTSVKEIARVETEGSTYAFDYDKLALEPLREVTEKLTNPRLQKNALTAFTKIQRLGGKKVSLDDIGTLDLMKPTTDVPALRTFENLLDLNVEVNKFSRMGWVKKNSDIARIDKIKANIKAEIEKAAKANLSNPEAWLKSWKQANVEYGKMADLEKNVLARALRRGALRNPDGLKTLMKISQAEDATFRDVLDSLHKTNPRLVELTENSVVKGFIDQATTGTPEGMQVIDFVKLDEELKHVRLTAPKARTLKRTISEFAKIYRNDPALARHSKGFQVESINQSLATDFAAKTHYALNASIFRQLQKFKPTQAGRAAALVNQISKSLANPLDSRAAKDIMKHLPADPAFENQLSSQLLELGKFGVRSDFPEVKIYRVATEGKSNAKSKGALGKGVYYHATQASANKAKREGSKVTSVKINPKDIVDEHLLKEILGVDEVTKEMIRENPLLQEKLLGQGKKGIIINDQIILFNH